MALPSIFISHRTAYTAVARALKWVIETAADRQIEVFISEDIQGGNDWRPSIEKHLREGQSLFLIYGAPYEDWSWCFYEAGYFSAVNPSAPDRKIYCLIRPDIPKPSPLSHLEMVTSNEKLIADLKDMLQTNRIKVDEAKLRELAGKLEQGLFGQIREFEGYPRIYFGASDAEFAEGKIPATAGFTGDSNVLGDLFTIQAPSVAWGTIEELTNSEDGKKIFMDKWLEEMARITLAARKGQFIAPQCVLIGRNGMRYRTLLHRARTQADGMYRCEFLAIQEVGGPLTGLPKKQLALLTGIRMGYRFKSEVIQKFSNDVDALSAKERQLRIQQIPRTIEDLTVESTTRGNITRDDFLEAFEEADSERLSKLLDYWPILTQELYKSLGLDQDGKTVIGPGLTGPDVERYRTAFNAMRLLNIEFLSRCCARVSQSITKSNEELSKNAKTLEEAVRALTSPDLKSAARGPAISRVGSINEVICPSG